LDYIVHLMSEHHVKSGLSWDSLYAAVDHLRTLLRRPMTPPDAGDARSFSQVERTGPASDIKITSRTAVHQDKAAAQAGGSMGSELSQAVAPASGGMCRR
jgi:hypothetical protein